VSFPQYPKYKDSGVEGLGDVPAHWDMKPLRFLCTIRKGRLPVDASPPEPGQVLLPYLSMDYLRGETEAPKWVAWSPGLLRADDGDVLLLWDGSNAGEFLRARCGIVSSTMALIEGRGVVKDFLFFACKTIEGWLRDQTVGMGIPHVSSDDLKSRLIPCPACAEQTGIAAFLQQETAKIDALIAEQWRLIELLKEKRQAVISLAVTKGLNPHAPMKSSGIEWLDEIPEHWRAASLKHLAGLQRNSFTDGDWIESPYITDRGVRLIQTGNVGVGVYKEQGYRYVSEDTFRELQCTEVLPGDVLICRLDGPVGRACLVPDLGGRMITSVDNTILKVTEGVRAEFVVALLSSVPWLSWTDALCRVGGGFRLRISRSMLGEMRVPLPSTEEQARIAAFLGEEMSGFDELIGESERAIALLRERRSALISAAVTGKIDVRGFVDAEAA
jgi:type I restriction enzyme, S subunit